MKKITLNGQSLLIYTVFAILFIACIWTTIHALKPINTENYQVVTIHSGDTIWGIAKDYNDELKPTAFVKWVEDVNHIESKHIQVGEKIIIPVKKDVESEKSHYELASK